MTTTNDPDQIRQQIEATRGRLSQDVNNLASSARPSAMVHRRVAGVRGWLRSGRHHVMGSSDGPGPAGRHSMLDSAQSATGSVLESAQSATGSAAETVQHAPELVRQQTQGNPIAAGLVVFGVAWLAGSLVPASEPEQEAARRVGERAAPLARQAGQQVAEAAKDVGHRLEEPAKDAARSVQETAAEAVDNVRQEAGSSVRQQDPSQSGPTGS